MSFGDLERGGGGGGMPSSSRRHFDLALSSGAGSSSQSDPDGERKLWDRASHTVFMISNNVASIQKLAGQFGTQRDTPDMRQKLAFVDDETGFGRHHLTDDTREMIRQTTVDLKQLVGQDGGRFENRQRKIAHQKLQKDFEEVLKRFQNVSKLVAEKSREYVARARSSQQAAAREQEEDDEAGEEAPLMGRDQRLQIQALDNEIDYNESLITEREEDLKDIERSILEVNEIFRDLGTLVHEQGHLLDNIESNVQSVEINMENATGELRTASKWQKAARSKMCCLALIIAIVGVVLILILLS
ncbi:SNAP receptor [Borealophlyctis nickersoniae]|nr:SNAP receptor [Borealophlyctis nickersoniae]